MIPEIELDFDQINLDVVPEPLKHFNHIGMRADKHEVVDYKENGAKEVEYYTLDCPECDGTGRYDRCGEVVCESCGFVIGGEGQFALPTEQDGGRGWSQRGDGLPGSKEPLV